MSTPNSPTSASTPSTAPAPSSSRDAVADAIALRLASSSTTNTNLAQERVNQEEKRALRRILYAGLERHNDAKLALESVRTLSKLSKNILDHPDEEKYRSFKSTNATIVRTLIEPPSALEFAIAVGFRADIQNFQPFYVFNASPKNLQSLQNGVDCLQEYIDREEAKMRGAKNIKETQKEAEARQRELVKLAYEDDRREKQRRDEMEKQRRDAVAARAAAQAQAEAQAQALSQAQAALNSADRVDPADRIAAEGNDAAPTPALAPAPPPYSYAQNAEDVSMGLDGGGRGGLLPTPGGRNGGRSTRRMRMPGAFGGEGTILGSGETVPAPAPRFQPGHPDAMDEDDEDDDGEGEVE